MPRSLQKDSSVSQFMLPTYQGEKQNKHTPIKGKSNAREHKEKHRSTCKAPAAYWQPPLRLTQYVGSPSMRVCTTTKAKSSLVQLFLSERPVNLWFLEH